MLSKWEVSDATSPQLMDAFYKNLRQGFNRDEALQQAKLAFLNTSNNLSENPLYRGSFYLLGDNASLELTGLGSPKSA